MIQWFRYVDSSDEEETEDHEGSGHHDTEQVLIIDHEGSGHHDTEQVLYDPLGNLHNVLKVPTKVPYGPLNPPEELCISLHKKYLPPERVYTLFLFLWHT